ncbi:MAG: sulfite exporter TauE/SafE family protein [Planctomycetes bacterium]|nr:sulfite exporter TauE/SafE family protein [Planctomycetota bacterium]
METLLVAALILLVAVTYSSVGHGGASGYLAVMALVGVAPEVMKPAALLLNVLVAGIATVRFHRAGCFRWSLFWPFAAASVPAAFVGGVLTLPAGVYRSLVGLVLLAAAVRLVMSAASRTVRLRRPALLSALGAGAGIGLLSGLTGTGGGIFLSPLLLLMRWADARLCAGVSAAFILVNSLAGLGGRLWSVPALPAELYVWAAAALIGGAIGAELGSRRVSPKTLRYLLAAVLTVAGFKMMLVAS